MTNPLLQLQAQGQSVWLDDIDREQLRSGLSTLAEVGFSYDQITQQLQDEGVQKFADSFGKLFTCIESKRKAFLEKTLSHG